MTIFTVSDADSLALFKPTNLSARKIENKIQTHPLTRFLRSDPSFTESRPHFKFPAPLRAIYITTSSLIGPERITVPPLAFTTDDGKSATGILHIGKALSSGRPGVVHGGLLATLLDEALSGCCCAAFPSKLAITRNLNIEFLSPAPADAFYVVKARVVSVDDTRAWGEGTIEVLDGNGGSKLVAEGKGCFIEPCM